MVFNRLHSCSSRQDEERRWFEDRATLFHFSRDRYCREGPDTSTRTCAHSSSGHALSGHSSLNRMASILQSTAVEVPTLGNKRLERTSLLAKAAERNVFREDSFAALTLVITALLVQNLEEHLHHILGSPMRSSRRKQIEFGISPLLHVITQ